MWDSQQTQVRINSFCTHMYMSTHINMCTHMYMCESMCYNVVVVVLVVTLVAVVSSSGALCCGMSKSVPNPCNTVLETNKPRYHDMKADTNRLRIYKLLLKMNP